MEYCKAARVVKDKYPHVKFILLGGFDTSFGALKQEDLQPYIDDEVSFPEKLKIPLITITMQVFMYFHPITGRDFHGPY